MLENSIYAPYGDSAGITDPAEIETPQEELWASELRLTNAVRDAVQCLEEGKADADHSIPLQHNNAANENRLVLVECIGVLKELLKELGDA